MIVTNHARERAYERLGIPAALLPRMAQQAYDTGHRPEDMPPRLRQFLDRTAERYRHASPTLRIMAEHVWIYCPSERSGSLDPKAGYVLVTVRPMRPDLTKLTPRGAVRITSKVL